MNHQQTAKSYLLFSRPQGETSLWLSLLTLEQGRLSLTYKGGRKQVSHCRSFQAYQLLWVMSRQGEGGWCRSLEAMQHRPILTGMTNWSGLYANELLHRLLPLQQPYPSIFVAYEQLLTRLHQHHENTHSPSLELAWALRQFEWQLLCGLGYAPPLVTEEEQPLSPFQRYEWQNTTHWHQTNTGILGQYLLQLAQTDAPAITEAEGLQAMRLFLQHRLTLIIPNLPFVMRQWWENKW
jgi:DNA repair protein RecO (recombination protein O)